MLQQPPPSAGRLVKATHPDPGLDAAADGLALDSDASGPAAAVAIRKGKRFTSDGGVIVKSGRMQRLLAKGNRVSALTEAVRNPSITIQDASLAFTHALQQAVKRQSAALEGLFDEAEGRGAFSLAPYGAA